MIKVRVDIDLAEPLSIIENDRGEWQVLPFVPESCCWHMVGFGGENIISIHAMTLQSGRVDITVIMASVDSYAKIERRLVAYHYLDETINALLALLCDYPKEL